MRHYYCRNWEPVAETRQVHWETSSWTLAFHTASGVFSKSRVDPGTKLLVREILKEEPADDFLDLACGYGPVGIALGCCGWSNRIHFCDVNFKALRLLKMNLERNQLKGWIHCGDGAEALSESRFDAIGLNPPIRAGKEKVFGLIRGGLKLLRPGGRFYLVMRTKQGALRLRKAPALANLSFFEMAKGGGYRVFRLKNH